MNLSRVLSELKPLVKRSKANFIVSSFPEGPGAERAVTPVYRVISPAK